MKKATKMALTALSATVIVCGAIGMSACGDKEPEITSETYSYTFITVASGEGKEKVKSVADKTAPQEIPYNFSVDENGALAMMLRAMDLKLTVVSDNTFTMTIDRYCNEDTEGSDIAVGEKFTYGNGMYAEWKAEASGTWTREGDAITCTFTYAKYILPDQGASYIVEYAFGGGSYYSKLMDADDYYGSWETDSTEKTTDGRILGDVVKAQFPTTVFTVSGSEIVTWGLSE